MKKLLTVGITMSFALVLSFGLSTTASAQDGLNEGDISIGAGLAYGFDIEELGLQANGTYVLKPDMRLGADIIYWLTEDSEVFSMTVLEVNANYHYIFYSEEDLILYGLGTLGIHYVKVESDFGSDFGGSASASDTELAIGVGAGVEYNLGAVSLFAEPRLFLSGVDQLALAFGARIPI